MEELDLKEIIKLFWNKKLQMILIISIFIIIGVIYVVQFVTPVYSSSTTLLLVFANSKETAGEVSSVTAAEITVNSKLVSTYRELVKSKRVVRQVISNLGIDIEEKVLKKNIKVNTVKDTELIEITVTNPKPEEAAKIANEIAKVFTKEIKEMYKIENIQVVDEAEKDNIPSNVNNKKDIAIFTGVGILVAVIYVLVVNMLDTTIKSVEDIENGYQIPVLVTIPVFDENSQKAKNGGKKRR